MVAVDDNESFVCGRRMNENHTEDRTGRQSVSEEPLWSGSPNQATTIPDEDESSAKTSLV